MLIAYSRLFRAVVIDKTQCESEERLFATLPGACQLVVGIHWLAAVAMSVTQLPDSCQTVARRSVGKKELLVSLNTVRQHFISKNFWIVTGAAWQGSEKYCSPLL